MRKFEDSKSLDSKADKDLDTKPETHSTQSSKCRLCDIADVELSLVEVLEESRAQGVIMDLALDAIVIIDETGAIVSFNRSAEAMFGYQREEVRGREITDVIIPPSLRTQHTVGFSRFLATGEARIINRRVEVMAMRSDGREFPIELTVTLFHARDRRFFTAFIRDITDRVEMERRLRQETRLVQLLHRLTSLANEASSIPVAMRGFLKEVCEYTGWPVGHVYLVRQKKSGTALCSSNYWYLADKKKYQKFCQITQRTVFAPGEGIPGKVYSTARPVWIGDVSRNPDFLRARGSKNLPIMTGFGLPVLIGREVVAVLEFYTPRLVQSDDEFLNTLSHIGIELGRVVEREKSTEQLRYLADHDTLTGLPNLRVGRDRLNQAVSTCKRQKSSFALLFIDLDGFKQINDSFGHESGDMVLNIVGKRISSTLRDMDTVARIGGDEFIVILSEIDSKAAVSLVAEKVIDVISRPIRCAGKNALVGVSVGIAFFPDDATHPEELINLADKAMYTAKYLGRNGFCFVADLTD